MKCLFKDKEECVIKETKYVSQENMANFCHACVGRHGFKTANISLKVMKAQLIIAFLRMFPNDMEKAKAEYQQVMRYVEEW